MNQEILNRLGVITDEEWEMINGRTEIDRNRYTEGQDLIIDSKKMLEHGKMISIRPHTRFAHFPKHKHNYIEVIYMCKGETVHIIDGETVVLKTGELQFLNQHATQEILPAGEADSGVNFIILPVQNLVENMVWTLLSNQSNKRSINQITMGLLFLQLMHYTDKISHTQLLQVKRLNQATVLLLNTRLSVTDISIAVGYDNTSYFHRIFRNYYGMSPKEYRDSRYGF